MSFGEKLKILRGKKTQGQVAADLNIAESTWAMYEGNKRTPRDEKKIEIAKYFGKSVQEIFFNQADESV